MQMKNLKRGKNMKKPNDFGFLLVLGERCKATAAIVDVKKPKMISGKDIKKTREDLNFSQSIFAKLLGISIKTLQALEQGKNQPKDYILRLIEIFDAFPGVRYKYLQAKK
jgi:putative transcriptional regulator